MARALGLEHFDGHISLAIAAVEYDKRHLCQTYDRLTAAVGNFYDVGIHRAMRIGKLQIVINQYGILAAIKPLRRSRRRL